MPSAQAATTPLAPRFDAPALSSLAAPGVETAGIHALAEGDFDGDGSPDFAGVPLGGAAPGASLKTGVAVYLGNGDGSFRAPGDYAAGPYPMEVVAARLRGPNAPLDLIVADAGSDASGKPLLSVLLGNGDGTFQAPELVQLPAYPGSLAAGDFNGDGKLDAAVGGNPGLASEGGLTILLGNGDGSFQAPRRYLAGTGLSVFYETKVADFNGDGKLDVVGMNPDGLFLSLGNGDGSFKPGVMIWADPTTYVGGQTLGGPSSFAVGDFDGDGSPDVALDVDGARLDVLLGTGTGAFVPAGEYPITEGQAGQGGGKILATDLEGSGKLDLVVATGWGATLAVLRGNGNGTFQSPVVYPLPEYDDEALLAADIDGDGKPDIVAPTSLGFLGGNTNYLTVLRNQGDGTFLASRQYPVVAPYDNQSANPVNPVGVALGDLNGDGALDLAVTEFDLPLEPAANGELPAPPNVDPGTGRVDTGGTVAVLLGKGDGSLGEERQYTVGGRPIAVAAGDLTGDGHEDLAVANAFSNTLSLLQGNGDGTFRAQVTIPVGTTPNALTLGDFNGDGKPDIAVTDLGDGDVSVLINRSTVGQLDFASPVSYPAGNDPNALVTGDFDGDGALDLAVTSYGDPFTFSSPSTLTVLPGRGDGTFRSLTAETLWSAHGADALATGDFDGDGKLDLAAANFALGEVKTFRGGGDGTFVPTGAYSVGAGPESIAVGDFNGDGELDLAVDDLNDGTVAMLVGKADGSFVPAADRTSTQPLPFGWAAFAYPTFLAVGDLNGNGQPDLVTANLFDAKVTVLGNTTPKPPPPPPTCFEDDDAHIAYAPGWHAGSDQDASAGHFRVANGKGMSFSFSTSADSGQLEYFYATSTKGGQADLYLDGSKVQTLSYQGSSGSLRQPAFPAPLELPLAGSGSHNFELKNASGPVYVDKLCVSEGSSSAQPASGPGQTSTQTDALAVGQTLTDTLSVPTNATSLSVLAESDAAVPFKLVLLDLSGNVLATADSSPSGIASLQAPAFAGGSYLLKLVDLGFGPVQIWSVATPQVQR